MTNPAEPVFYPSKTSNQAALVTPIVVVVTVVVLAILEALILLLPKPAEVCW
jgi:hypothetical protein